MVLAYNTNAGGGLASGVDKLADAFLEKRRREGLASGLEQIQNGDWQGGVNTISETDPNTALGLVQYKQKADDARDLEQMKIAAAEKARNSLTPYQSAMLDIARTRLYNDSVATANEEAKKAEAESKQLEDEQRSLDLAQNGINQLYEVGKANNLGVFTDWRRKHGLTGWLDNDVETDMGKISSAVAAVAPRAIAQLKKAGVSGINTKGEFMQYIGLPENPTSQQILGALPRMAEIAGVEMPIETQSSKTYNNSANAPLLNVGGTQNFNNGFTITRVE